MPGRASRLQHLRRQRPPRQRHPRHRRLRPPAAGPSNTCTLRLTAEDWYTFRYDARDDKLTLVRDLAKAGLCTGGAIDNIAGTYVIRPDGTGRPIEVSDLADNPSFAVSFNGLPVPGQAFEGLPEGATEGIFSLALKPPVAQAVRIGLPSSPDAVSVAVETFANLHYTLQRTSELREGFFPLDSPGAAAVGTGESVDLLDAAADLPGNAAFYRIHVATPLAAGP